MPKRIGIGINLKLQGHEMKTLKDNGILIKKVPYVDIYGRIKGKNIPVKVYPDNVDDYGMITIRREGGRIKPKRRNEINGIF